MGCSFEDAFFWSLKYDGWDIRDAVVAWESARTSVSGEGIG